MTNRQMAISVVGLMLVNAGSALGEAPSDIPAWPVYRGTPALTGVASGPLSDAPQLQWTFKAGDSIASSPVVGYGRVFFGSHDGKVYAVNVADGKQAWRFDTGDMVEAPPLLHAGSVYVGDMDGVFYSLKAEDGTENWRFETGARVVGSANVLRAGERDLVVVGSHDFFVYALDARTGEKVWAHESDSFINGAPAVYENQVVVGGCDAKVHVLSATDGTGYAVDVGSYIAGAAAVSRGEVFVGHYGNQLVKVNLRKRKIAWEFGSEEEGEPFFSSPAVDDRQVLAGCRDDYLYCVDRQTGVQKWRFETGGRVDAGPAICDGKVLFGSEDGRLYLLDLADGEELWRFDIGQPVRTSPAVVDGMFFVGAEDGRVYAFGGR